MGIERRITGRITRAYHWNLSRTLITDNHHRTPFFEGQDLSALKGLHILKRGHGKAGGKERSGSQRLPECFLCDRV